MTINELFEKHFADQNDIPAEEVKANRLTNGSYKCLMYSRAFRNFKAGFDAGNARFDAENTEKMQVLGYMTHKGVLNALSRKGAFFAENQTDAKCVPVFINERNAPKTGE